MEEYYILINELYNKGITADEVAAFHEIENRYNMKKTRYMMQVVCSCFILTIIVTFFLIAGVLLFYVVVGIVLLIIGAIFAIIRMIFILSDYHDEKKQTEESELEECYNLKNIILQRYEKEQKYNVAQLSAEARERDLFG